MRYNEQSSMRYEDAPRSRRQDFPEEQRTQKTMKYEREVLMNDIRPKPIRKLNDPRDRPDFPPQRTSSWDPDRDRKMRHRGSQDFEEQERTQRISSWVDGRDGAKLRIETREKFPREKWQPEGGRHRVDERKVEVEYSRGQSDRTNSGSRDRGRFPDDRPPAPSSRFTREVRQKR
uniref:Uncharacterized protein n=1 Tax=Ciona savignyi TaxID=51511 RepID=H2YK96_CIOSA